MTTMNKSVTIPGYPDLIGLVCQTVKTDRQMVESRCRKREYADARHICCYVAVTCWGFSYSAAARMMNRDHCTAKESVVKTQVLMQTDADFRAKVQAVIQNVSKYAQLCSTN